MTPKSLAVVASCAVTGVAALAMVIKSGPSGELFTTMVNKSGPSVPEIAVTVLDSSKTIRDFVSKVEVKLDFVQALTDKLATHVQRLTDTWTAVGVVAATSIIAVGTLTAALKIQKLEKLNQKFKEFVKEKKTYIAKNDLYYIFRDLGTNEERRVREDVLNEEDQQALAEGMECILVVWNGSVIRVVLP